MLIPGPHLINGLLDLVDNYIPMSIARLGLATSILIATAIGIALGIRLTLREFPLVEQNVTTDHLNVLLDMFLAGIVTDRLCRVLQHHLGAHRDGNGGRYGRPRSAIPGLGSGLGTSSSNVHRRVCRRRHIGLDCTVVQNPFRSDRVRRSRHHDARIANLPRNWRIDEACPLEGISRTFHDRRRFCQCVASVLRGDCTCAWTHRRVSGCFSTGTRR